MDKALVQHFRQRWQLVEEIQRSEARAASLELRWRQLNATYRLSQRLKLTTLQTDEMLVYERWAKLKAKISWTKKT